MSKVITAAAAAKFNPAAVITVNVPANPKRRAAAVRFALYRNGMTVAKYVKAVTSRKLAGGKAIAYRDLSWDSKVGFITITNP